MVHFAATSITKIFVPQSKQNNFSSLFVFNVKPLISLFIKSFQVLFKHYLNKPIPKTSIWFFWQEYVVK